MGKIIALIGNTGVGKTTIARVLGKTGRYNLGLEEHFTRPFQALFKSDIHYALANQIDYFLLRAEQEKDLRSNPLPGLIDGGLDQDFHGFTKLFHNRGLLNNEEFAVCARLYNLLRSQFPAPDLVIHLTASRTTIQQRLADRERINIASSDDLDLLDAYLGNWVASLPNNQVLRLDITSASSGYLEILSNLQNQICNRLELGIGN